MVDVVVLLLREMAESPKPHAAPPRETPVPRTPAELRAYADDLEARARLAAQAAYDATFEAEMVEARELRVAADVVERYQRGVAARDANAAAGGGEVAALSTSGNETLSFRVHHGTALDTMSSQETHKETRAAGMVGRKFTSRHPLPARAKALGKSIPAVAADVSKKLKRTIPRTTVRSWYAPKDSESARPIPIDAVRFFEAAPWSIPRDAWKNGIKDTD